MENNYHLIVIGAGPGGYVAAIKAAQLGKKVAIIENRQVGGTCLNRGCIPTKTLIHTTDLLNELRHAQDFGINTGDVTYDFDSIHQRKDEVVNQLRSGVEGLLKSNGIDTIAGTATITAENTVKVDDNFYHTDNILIATGSKVSLPPIAGINLPNVVTSDDLLEGNSNQYQSLVIIGGGVIGVEFATIYNSLGCDVTIIEAMDKILPGLDKEISQNLTMILKKRGVKIFTNSMVNSIEQEKNQLNCQFTAKENPQNTIADGILISTGRKANTECLLESGLNLNIENGSIVVDKNFKTNIKGIYAIGDVIKGSIQLAHVASAQGINAVEIMFGKKTSMDLTVIPSCIYTSPEIAVVGMTEAQAKELSIPTKTGKFIMSANGKSLITKADRGFVKIVSNSESDVIIGAQLMCSRATDMINELSSAIANKLTVDQLASVIHPHPTFGEGVAEALEDVHGKAIHIAPKRGLN